MKPLGWKRVLVLAPHTDDEIACAGTIARAVSEGADVTVFAFSHLDSKVLAEEFAASCDVLGVPAFPNQRMSSFPARRFSEHRQDILELICVMKGYDVVLCPSSTDTHQDHRVVHREALRATRNVPLVLGYQCPWNQRETRADVFVALTREQAAKRTDAATSYQSQAKRHHITRWWAEEPLHLWAGQGRAGLYAEAFELIRMRL